MTAKKPKHLHEQVGRDTNHKIMEVYGEDQLYSLVGFNKIYCIIGDLLERIEELEKNSTKGVFVTAKELGFFLVKSFCVNTLVS